MIVKDEVEVLERCLKSCLGLIDYWVICDTGSTDGTQELIRRCLADVPGELHQHEWVDFGHNRSELMRESYAKADYLLLLDADMTLTKTEPLGELRADSYLVRQGNVALDYRNKRVLKGGLRWRFVGRTHEYLECCDEELMVEQLDSIAVQHHADGHGWAHKFERDLAILTAELERDPDDPRTIFYLAQTHRDLGDIDGDDDHLRQALHFYERRAAMAGWAEETYVALYQAGLLRARLDDWPGAMDAYLRAWEGRPTRIEALHAMVSGLRERGRHRTAHRFTTLASGKGLLPVPDDILFVSPWVYNWGMLFEYSITTYWVGDFERSVAACAKLLRRDDLPAAYRRQTVANLQYGLRERADAAKQAAAPTTRKLEHVGRPTRGRAV
jgi:glycosyltransferase involved in cell wall biosynthesis